MSKSFLMGNEAIGLGAVRAGVKVVSGYPGTPSTEVLETVAKHNPGDIYVEWSVNEKAGMEVAAAAAYTGARTMVITTKIKELQYYTRFNEIFVLSLLILATNLVVKGLVGYLSQREFHPGKILESSILKKKRGVQKV